MVLGFKSALQNQTFEIWPIKMMTNYVKFFFYLFFLFEGTFLYKTGVDLHI